MLPTKEEFVAGGLAGAAQTIVGHPLDTIKTRLQTSNLYKGPIHCLTKTVSTQGPLALFDGLTPPLLGIAFVNAVLFSAYSSCRTVLGVASDSPIYLVAAAGGGAGFVNSFVAAPIELLKIRMQTSSNPNAFQLARSIVKSHGWSGGLFRGTAATIFKEIPAYAGFYAGFEYSKRLLARFTNESPQDLSVGYLMLAGSIGGMSYWTCCYPLDVAKSTIQKSNQPNISTNPFVVLKNIYKQAGIKGLLNGYATSLIRSIPSAASTFTVYELSMRYFNSV